MIYKGPLLGETSKAVGKQDRDRAGEETKQGIIPCKVLQKVASA